MMASAEKRQGRFIAVGVCLLCLAVAAFVGYRVWQSSHYSLPFSEDSIESVVLYRHICAWSTKKEIDRREDIAQIAALVNGMRIKGAFDPFYGGPAGGQTIHLSFRTSDGRVFNCLLADWHGGAEATSVFVDGDRRFEVEKVDLLALWDGLAYEEQEGRASSEIDTSGLTVLPPELIPPLMREEYNAKYGR